MTTQTPRGRGVLSQCAEIERTFKHHRHTVPMSSVHLGATARRPGKSLRGRCGLAPSVGAAPSACAAWRPAPAERAAPVAGGAMPPPALSRRRRSIVGVGGLHLAFERVHERRAGEDDGGAYEGDDEHHLKGDMPRGGAGHGQTGGRGLPRSGTISGKLPTAAMSARATMVKPTEEGTQLTAVRSICHRVQQREARARRGTTSREACRTRGSRPSTRRRSWPPRWRPRARRTART